MLKIYIGASNSSTRKAVNWCKDTGIPFQKIRLSPYLLSHSELKNLLTFTDNGLEDLLVRTCDPKKFDKLQLHDALSKLIADPSILKTPIIFDGKRLLIGYHPEEIRCFLPKRTKRLLL